MSIPQRKINNFVSVKSKPNIDSISRNFILIEVLCGLFRLPLLGIGGKIQLTVMFCITVLYNIAIMYNIYTALTFHSYTIAPVFEIIEFTTCTILGFVLNKEMLEFYIEINRIDEDLNFSHKSQVKNQLVIHFVQIFTIGLTFSISVFLVPESKYLLVYVTFLIPMKLLHYIELNYYGYLFYIILPRLTHLRDMLKRSCYITEEHTAKKQESCNRIRPSYDIIFLMDSYNHFLRIYECLNKAIKWQILTIIISTFNIALSQSYHVAKLYLNQEKEKGENFTKCINFTLLVIEILPLVAPCLSASLISASIVHLKEIITSGLCQNKLEKVNRSSARAFLELLETQPLYFPLLHLFDVDFTLPFKLLSLILTYLIILLQFDRVINVTKVV